MTEEILSNNKVTVLHLITGLGTGGAERMLTRLVTTSDDPDIRHIVASITGVGGFRDEIEEAGVSLFELKMSNIFLLPNALRRLHLLVKSNKVDIMQTWLYHADLMGILYKKLFFYKGKLFWNIRCSNMTTKRYIRFVKFLRKFSMIPDKVLFNSHAGKIYHKEAGYLSRQWIYIPNGIDVDRFSPDIKSRETLNQMLKLHNDDILICVVARNDAMKGHDVFLKAFATLHKNNPKIKAVLIGYDTEKLAKQDGVISMGRRFDIHAILPGFDFLCMPSIYGEGFPNVIGEAMSSGLPCVVADVGDSANIVGETGIVVAPGSVLELTEGLQTMCAKGGTELVSLGAMARSRILENWNLKNITAKYNKLYSDDELKS